MKKLCNKCGAEHHVNYSKPGCSYCDGVVMSYNKTGAELIADERQRQTSKEGWSSEHDDEHKKGQLAMAGACYGALAAIQQGPNLVLPWSTISKPDDDNLRWPWAAMWWKPSNDPIKNLVRAGALIAAEIDRLQRLSCKQRK